MNNDGTWLGIEIAAILLTYVIGMLCLLAFLFGFGSPITILEGAFVSVSWWVVSLKIKEYRHESLHPPDENAKDLSVKSK